MNAHAHLLSLGWAGTGHSLDSRPDNLPAYKQKGHRGLAYDPSRDPAKVGNTGVGLVKPLSISHRKARLGIGKKAHEPSSGTEWWLKGFESALGNIGKSESERSSGVSTPTGNGNTRFDSLGGKHGGLYGFFIRGQMMEGTIHEKSDEHVSRGTKRKSDALDEGTEASSELLRSQVERKTRKKEKKAVSDFETASAFISTSQKDDEKRRRDQKNSKQSATDQFAQIGQFLQVQDDVDPDSPRKKRKDKKDKKRRSEAAETLSSEENNDQSADGSRVAETKEQRRERRRERREKREAKRQARLEAKLVPKETMEEKLHRAQDLMELAKAAKVKKRKPDI